MNRLEEILNEVYNEIGSPIKMEEDKTYWKVIALEAMKRLKEEIEDEYRNIFYELDEQDID